MGPSAAIIADTVAHFSLATKQPNLYTRIDNNLAFCRFHSSVKNVTLSFPRTRRRASSLLHGGAAAATAHFSHGRLPIIVT